MSEVLIVNDIHLADRAPIACTETYLDDLFELLEQIGHIGASRHAQAIIWAGDVFDAKTPSRTSHATIRRLIDLIATYPCPVWVVPGNHDLSHDRLDSLYEGQPLGVLLAAGALRLLHGWAPPDAPLPHPVYGVPWLGEWSDERVSEALADWRARPRPDGAPGLVVTHAPLYPPGQELPYEHYPTARFAAAMGGHGSVIYGHIHQPHGVYTVDGVTFANPGALSRGALHEYNLHRALHIAAWDTDTGAVRLLPLTHKSAQQVFRLAERASQQAEQARVEGFLRDIGATRVQITSIDAVMRHVRTLALRPAVPGLINELLEQAR